MLASSYRTFGNDWPDKNLAPPDEVFTLAPAASCCRVCLRYVRLRRNPHLACRLVSRQLLTCPRLSIAMAALLAGRACVGVRACRQIDVERDIKVSLMHHMTVLRSIVVMLGKIKCAVHVDFWIDVQASDVCVFFFCFFCVMCVCMYSLGACMCRYGIF